mmetsp:Transcript_44330/g.143847  ORF Transcript_44330/g.143847 Transcript_44330/m.143847 type:complete len:212 (+) Transcript_44330:560-1195(+)
MIAILMGSWCSLTVPRSCRVMLKDESPSTNSTSLSGCATCAPMAAGSPKPIVPSEPEETIERGSLQRKNWHDIIWWLPTPVETTSFSRCGLKPKLSASITCCVLIRPSGSLVYEKGKSALSDVQRACHSARSLLSTSGSSSRIAATQSPGTATVGCTTRPNCDGSMSKWMKPPRPSAWARNASGAYCAIAPVVRSSKRDPMATMRSASWMA